MSLPLVPDANHPAFPTRSQVDDWEIKRPAILDSGEEMAVIGQRCAQAKPSIKNSLRPVASAPTHSTQNIASKPAREQERAARPTRSRTCGMRGHVPREKKEFREAKRRSAEKIKARASAWRNKSEIKTGNGDNTKTNPREEPKWKDIARSRFRS